MTSASARKTDGISPHLEDLQARAVGAYLGLAVGDALGATVEFMTPREIELKHGKHRDITGGGWLKLKAGQITDDTQMSLALGSALLNVGGVKATAIAEAFDDWLKSKPVDVGSTVRRGIVRYRNQGTTQGPVDEYDAGNGAVMRVLPMALFTIGAPGIQVRRACEVQAHITHNAPLADDGMLTVVEMVQCALLQPQCSYKDAVQMAHTLGRIHKSYIFTKKRQENPSGFLPDTLRAVFQSFARTDNFESALIDVVNRGGDADTTGAILGMIAGAQYGKDAIPARWLKTLDADVKTHCEAQALRLLKRSPLVTGEALKFYD
ncbi:ADP-ribosyl-[dinitrogen reductase] hydrolase [Magnetovibrio sp. PR-2]|uniref:ADP-ribosyl-[dinitrogen reductase] hydrolase n=1 Tax=Magnetovibrio sp. PR-2 TaxID=3120356 RepID=UPI002FCE276E